jgi:cysteine synthase
MKTPLEKIVRNAPVTPALTPADYLRKILNARVYDVAVESALEKARALSARLGNTVLLKREDQQPVFSFKLRGAYNKMAHLSAAQLASGVICASAGNHAQGVALGARKLGTRAVIVMPVTTPRLKIDAVRGFGGEIVLHGESYSDAYLHALELQAQQNLTFVHPFDDPDVIAGQGTIAMEILRQHQGPLDAVFVAIGGGGLISGVANYIKAVRPEIKVIGVQMNDSDAMMQSVGEEREALFAVTIPEERGSFRRFCELVSEMPTADVEATGTTGVVGGALRNVTEFNYRISDAAKAHVFVGLTTSQRGESATIAQTFNEHGFDALDLTHDELAKEHLRHLVGGRTGLAHDERLLRFVFPERPGALLKFLSLMKPNWNISLFHYRNQGADYGRILVGLQVPGEESAAFNAFLETLGYPYVEETANPAYRLFLQA